MGFEPSRDTPSELILEYRKIYIGRQSETWKRFGKYKSTIIVAGDGPSLNQFDSKIIHDSDYGLICCNSAGIWASMTDNKDRTFCQIMTDTAAIFDAYLPPDEVPTFVAPSILTRQWLNKIRGNPFFRVLLTSFNIFNQNGEEFARPDPLLFPSYDLVEDGINLCGESVLLSGVQLAVHFGATRVILIGTDMRGQFEGQTRNAFIAFRESMKAYGVTICLGGTETKIDVLPHYGGDH